MAQRQKVGLNVHVNSLATRMFSIFFNKPSYRHHVAY